MRRFVATVGFYLAGAACLFGQAPGSPVVGVGTFIHVVADLDKTIRFYGNLLGLEMNGAPGPRAFSANAVVENLYDAKGSQSRVAVFKIPGSPLGVEFVEFKDAAQKPFRPHPEDPGASVLWLPVGNIDSVMTKLREDGALVADHPALVQDPDGFFIHLVGGGTTAKLTLAVDNTDRTLRLFRDLLGFQPETKPEHPGYRTTTAKVPGTDFEVEFAEYREANRAAAAHGIHDPGAGVLRLVVRDVDALLQTLKGAGVPVVSAGGEPVSVGNRHFVILRDPDNFFFQIIPQAGPGGR